MGMIERPDVFGHVIFCDDIRSEVGGKTSFIGCYLGYMFIDPELPLVIPKFGLSARVSQKKEVFNPNTEIRVFLPGDKENEPSTAFQIGERKEGDLISRFDAPEKLYISMAANMVFSPLVVPELGVIREFVR